MATAVGLPMLLIMVVGATELQNVWSDKQRTQDVADAAALMGASQLRIDAVGATTRAQAFADAQLAELKSRATVTIGAAVLAPGVMKVSIDTHRMSFFANLLPPGGFYTHVDSIGKGEGLGALCVLGIGGASSLDDVQTLGTSKLDAKDCMVHANHDLIAAGGTSMVTNVAEAVGASSGLITPTTLTGAAAIADPFATLTLTPPPTCNVELDQYGTPPAATTTTSTLTKTKLAKAPKHPPPPPPNPVLQPGLHCAEIDIWSGGLTLAAGEHWFQQGLFVGPGATFDGSAGVAMVFENGATLDFDPAAKASSIVLTGEKTGLLKGFVLVATRDYVADFHLSVDPIASVTGTIYLPGAALMVDGTHQSNAGSPWTVVASRGMSVTGAADLVINANYAFSDVTVPEGVGNKARYTRLAH